MATSMHSKEAPPQLPRGCSCQRMTEPCVSDVVTLHCNTIKINGMAYMYCDVSAIATNVLYLSVNFFFSVPGSAMSSAAAECTTRWAYLPGGGCGRWEWESSTDSSVQ